MRPLQPLRHTAVALRGGFWGRRLETNREVTLPLVYEQCRRTGRLAAFDLAWKPGRPRKPHVFWDSDVAKWVEAAAYALAERRDPRLSRRLEHTVRRIVAAQGPDGYLNSYFTAVDPAGRWRNLRDNHELYCAGHLIEAGVAHAEATGRPELLDAVGRYADLIGSVFGRGRGKLRGYPGHQEIELALVRLYRATGNRRHLELARYFLDQRGRRPHWFDREARARGERPGAWRFGSYEYSQCHLPVREQTEAVGHAVRALYMACGMVDVAAETGDGGLQRAALRLWDSIASRRMYLTGAVGSSAANEGFTRDHDLPDEGAYAETCAAIAFVLLNHRLLQVTRQARHADLIELGLMNACLCGVSLSGERFFYSSPLASHDPAPGRTEEGGLWDGLSKHRQPWFGCACCPPNLARLLAGLGRLAASAGKDGLWLHLYGAGTIEAELGGAPLRLAVQTDYPWDGRVELAVIAAPGRPFSLRLRLPGWCRGASWTARAAGVRPAEAAKNGYLEFRGRWRPGDRLELDLPMPAQRVYAHPSVRHAAGLAALRRGPLIYCLESADNPGAPLERFALPDAARIEARRREGAPAGAVTLHARGLALAAEGRAGALYRPRPPRAREAALTAIPFCLWDNRAPGSMRVWLRRG